PMLPKLPSHRTCWLFVILFLLFPLMKAEAIQIVWGGVGAAKPQKRTASPAVPPNIGDAPKPQLLNADSNPTLRYPVSVRESSISCGWLDVTRTGVSYTVVESGRKSRAPSAKKFAPIAVEHLVAAVDTPDSEGFNLSLSEIKYIGLQKSILLLFTPNQKWTLIYLSQEYWGTVVEKPRQFE